MKKMKIRYPESMSPDPFNLEVRRETSTRELVKAIVLTAEVCGQSLSSEAAEMLAGDLAHFNEAIVLAALARCRMELQGRLKVSDILARIEDGRPDVDEAWAMMPSSELASVVWTNEMAQAWGVAQPLLHAGDIAKARTAFQETYAKLVLEARIRKEPIRWMPSLGTDAAGRQTALLDAVRKRRLSAAHAEQLLPAGSVIPAVEEQMRQSKLKNLH